MARRGRGYGRGCAHWRGHGRGCGRVHMWERNVCRFARVYMGMLKMCVYVHMREYVSVYVAFGVCVCVCVCACMCVCVRVCVCVCLFTCV